MKGSITLKILQTIAEMGMEAVELCEAIMIAGYGASYSRIIRVLESRQDRRYIGAGKSQEKLCIRNYQKLISKLKNDGLVTEKTAEGKRTFFITERGRTKLVTLSSQLSRQSSFLRYKMVSSTRPVIVSFDVPEKEKWKREWLREVLKNIGLKKVHQSVWIGMVKIPEEFFEDLRSFQMVEYVEIFEVGKSGTLKHLA